MFFNQAVINYSNVIKENSDFLLKKNGEMKKMLNLKKS